MVPYEELVKNIVPGCVLSMKEFSFSMTGVKYMALSIDNAIVYRVIQPNQCLSKDEILEYYGEVPDLLSANQLSSINCLRVVLLIGVTDNSPKYLVVLLNKDYYNSSIQQITIIQPSKSEPIYSNSNLF